MALTFNSSAVATNRDWKTQFQFTDGDQNSPTYGQLIDFTGAFISITLEDPAGCPTTWTTDSGEVAIIGPGTFELSVNYSVMNFCPGTGQMGAFYQLNGETIDLFEGELTLRRGIGKP
jgi:hypothetical protein